MQLKKITKTGQYYLLKLSDDKVYKVSEEIIIKYHLLKPNMEISEEALALLLNDNEYYLLLDKMIKYQMSLHSKKEVYLHFISNYDNALVEKGLSKLDELGLNNDYLYAVNYINNSYKKEIGLKRVKTDLSEKGIANALVLKALDDYDFNSERESCEKAFQKHLPLLAKEASSNKRRKMENFLQYRGYSDNSLTFVLEKNALLLDNKNKDNTLLVTQINKLLKLYENKLEPLKLKNKIIRSLTNKGFKINEILKEYESRKKND